jgi:hypothetical protein
MEADSVMTHLKEDGRGFLVRPGPAYQRGDVPCQEKLCSTSTSVSSLAELLFQLSQREDCWYVKLDAEKGPHGMVRGRCSLTTADEVGKLWTQLKVGTHWLCAVQDDDFTSAFR